MKMERISENQIRCTLTPDDLSNRKIKLSELAYGSEKARHLFYDMMQQANIQFGFDSNGSPLMIEAIPSTESLILNITKVSDPEELDTRFSSFSSPSKVAKKEVHITGADGILNLLKKIKEISESVSEGGNNAAPAGKQSGAERMNAAAANLAEVFRFANLDDAINASKSVNPDVVCVNSLYKYDEGEYLLVVHSEKAAPESINRIFNVLSEYGSSEHCPEGLESHLREHGCLMIADNALQRLAAL